MAARLSALLASRCFTAQKHYFYDKLEKFSAFIGTRTLSFPSSSLTPQSSTVPSAPFHNQNYSLNICTEGFRNSSRDLCMCVFFRLGAG
jgi:hypothetical protein